LRVLFLFGAVEQFPGCDSHRWHFRALVLLELQEAQVASFAFVHPKPPFQKKPRRAKLPTLSLTGNKSFAASFSLREKRFAENFFPMI
jgi:hypothetical protein